MLNSLNREREGLPLLVTLTYPGAHRWNELDLVSAKRHLDSFWKRVRRGFPNAHAIWKLEPQMRGAPHFHLLVFGFDFRPVEQFSRMWWRVVGSDDIANLRCGVDIRVANSWRAVSSYVAKYLAKVVEQLPLHWRQPGRWWGLLTRRLFVVQLESIAIPRYAAQRLRRIMARRVFLSDQLRRVEYLSRRDIGLSLFENESTARRLIEWSLTPRWESRLLRDERWRHYRRQLFRIQVRASMSGGKPGVV